MRADGREQEDQDEDVEEREGVWGAGIDKARFAVEVRWRSRRGKVGNWRKEHREVGLMPCN